MNSNSIALRCAGLVIVACAAFAPAAARTAPATSADDASDEAPSKHHANANAKKSAMSKDDSSTTRKGMASFYSRNLAGNKTSSGQRYDPKALTAAHRSLPMGTKLKVVNPKNDKSVVVTVNDRGPVPKNRMIDLSNEAASQLGMTKSGVTKVETEVVGKTDGSKAETKKNGVEGEEERR
jgi:rare lipoprotein A